MTEDADPLLTFFTASEAEDPDLLYTTLGVERTAEREVMSKAYRKAALRCHPDKHTGKGEGERATLTAQFQRIGFAFAVLRDEKRRKRYDATGRTDELVFADAEGGWDEYFNDLFERIDRKALDEDKKKYQGSEEELEDLREAYTTSKGSFDTIMSQIPHSTHHDEARLVAAVESEIDAGRLTRTRKWTASSKDTGARKKRKRAAEAEAAEAEEAAKRLGVWDEFYGSGAKGKRAGDLGKGKKKEDEDEEGEAGLAALIRSRQTSRASNFAALEAKYSKVEEKKGKGKKKGKKEEPHPEELDDAAFEALQAKMFGDKAGKSGGGKSKKAEPHPDDLDDAAFEALQAKMLKKRKTK